MSAENLTHMEAITFVKRAKQTIAEMQQDIAKWKIEITFQTDPNTFDVMVIASAVGRPIVAKIPLTRDMIQYYRDDQAALLDTVCEAIFEQLIREQLISEMSPNFKRVIANTLMVMDRSK